MCGIMLGFASLTPTYADWDAFPGWEGEFEILEFDEARSAKTQSGILVSRRAVLERKCVADEELTLANLHGGDNVEGIVTNIAEFGAFVKLDISRTLRVRLMSYTIGAPVERPA